MTAGWDQKDIALTPETGAVVIPPMLPHTPWPMACDEESVVYAWGHPTGVEKPLSTDFFQQLFLYCSDVYDAKTSPNLLQLLLMQ